MLWRTMLLEKDKVFGRTIFWIELAILTLLIVIVDVAQYLLSLSLPSQGATILDQTFEWPNGLVNGAQFAGAHSLGGLLLIILVGVVTAREYSWRTFHLWLSRGVSRLILLEAKCIILVSVTLAIVLTSLLISGITTGILTLLVQGTLNADQINVWQVILNCLITDFALLPYVALAFMLTIISRSSILAIGVGLTFLLLVETTLYTVFTIAGGKAALIVQYLPMGLEAALHSAELGSQSDAVRTLYPSPLIACGCIALYTIVLTAIAMWSFLYQNFTD